MRSYSLLFSFIITTFCISAQSKHFIYFKDKGIQPSDVLSKNSESFFSAKSLLTERAVERRRRAMGENYITYEDIPVNEEYVAELENYNVKIVHRLKWFNAVSALLSGEKLRLIKHLNFVKKVERVAIIKNFYPEDYEILSAGKTRRLAKLGGIDYGPSYAQLQVSEIPAVHRMGFSGKGVLIGLLDTGFKWKNNPAVENVKVLGEHDFVFGDNITENETGDDTYQHNHGSYVLSIAGAKLEGQLVGPAFNSSFYLAKTEDIRSEKRIEEDNYAAGLEWLESRGVDITSSSLGYSEFDDSLDSYTYSDMDGKTTIVAKAAEFAFQRGVVTVTSAGNEGNKNLNYIVSPADGVNILSAVAVSSSGRIASFSSRGPTFDGRIKPDLMAMGTSTAFAFPTGQVGFGGGTSFSAPILCGITALLLEAYPHLTNNQVRSIMLESGDRTANPDTAYGYGIASALKAVTFPNVEQIGNSLRLHKIFADTSGIIKNSISIEYSTNSMASQSASLTNSDSIHYYFDFPNVADSDTFAFHFNYYDMSGKSFHEPLMGDYKLPAGSLIIKYQLEENLPEVRLPADKDLLSNSFPNPFVPVLHSRLKVNIVAKEQKYAQVNIFNSLGQKVNSIFNGLVQSGTTVLNWDGRNASGSGCASGAYIIELKLGDEYFRQKMMLIR